MESKHQDESAERQGPALTAATYGERPPLASRIFQLLLDFALLGTAFLAIVLLVNPFPRWVAPPQVGAGLTFTQVLAYRNGALVLGAVLLFAALVAVLLRLRWRVAHFSSLGQRACPRCGSTSLRRIRRRWYHHLFGLLGIPLYRFVCSDCRWQGTRAFKDPL
ncbi:MAG: hypothetical protein RRC07_08615 [Anaerolineae bacterium]|nr:hypothetical protein [Anaerolineae bacterium]